MQDGELRPYSTFLNRNNSAADSSISLKFDRPAEFDLMTANFRAVHRKNTWKVIWSPIYSSQELGSLNLIMTLAPWQQQ